MARARLRERLDERLITDLKVRLSTGDGTEVGAILSELSLNACSLRVLQEIAPTTVEIFAGDSGSTSKPLMGDSAKAVPHPSGGWELACTLAPGQNERVDQLLQQGGLSGNWSGK